MTSKEINKPGPMRILLLCVSLFLAGEVVSRLFISSPSAAIPDEDLGWIWEPQRSIFHTKEGWATNKVNSLGFNDEELKSVDGRENLLILGDSFTEAMQVPRAANFVSKLASMQHCRNLINAGRSGMAMTHFLLMAEKFEQQTRIDHIVLVLNRWDIEETMQNTGEIHRSENGEISAISHSFRQPHRLRQLTEIVFSNSSLASYLLERIKMVRAGSAGQGADAEISGQASPASKGAKLASEAEAKQRAEQEQARKFEQLADYVMQQLQQVAPVNILYIPELKYAHNAQASESEGSIATAKVFAQLAARNGVPFHSAANHLIASYAETHQPPFGFANAKIHYGHLNARGHVSVARAVNDLLPAICEAPAES